MLLTKLDSHFNVEWSKEFGDPHQDDIGKKLAIVKDGYIISGVRNNLNLVGLGLKYRAEIIKTDTAGTKLWEWLSDSTKETGHVFDILHTKDGGYIYCGIGNGYEEVRGSAGYMHWKGWVEKLDSNRRVIWYDTIGNSYSLGVPLVKMNELADSSIVVGGILGGGFDGELSNTTLIYASLIKYKLNGEKVKQTQDGGYILCGESDDNGHHYGSPIQRAWVIKVDSNGCNSLTDPQCSTLKVVIEDAPKLSVTVYPNPARNVVNIALSQFTGENIVGISDVAGRAIISKKLTKTPEAVDISGLAAGVYIYHVTVDGLTVKTGRVVKY